MSNLLDTICEEVSDFYNHDDLARYRSAFINQGPEPSPICPHCFINSDRCETLMAEDEFEFGDDEPLRCSFCNAVFDIPVG